MRVGAQDGYDRLVFEYDRAVPYYEMMPNQAPPGGQVTDADRLLENRLSN